MSRVPEPGRVVILNGTSSAGKSTLATELQAVRERAGECWIVIGVDDFLPRLPARWMDIPGHVGDLAADGARVVDVAGGGVQFEFGAVGQRLLAAYRRSAAALARAGLNVIVDEVLIDERAWPDWSVALDGMRTTWVGVRCDTDVAIVREAERADRIVGLAEGNAEAVHRRAVYDLELDTTATPIGELVAQLDSYLARAARPFDGPIAPITGASRPMVE